MTTDENIRSVVDVVCSSGDVVLVKLYDGLLILIIIINNKIINNL